MNDNTILLSELATSVDSVRLFYADASIHSVRPWLKLALNQLVQAHQLIADDLCWHGTAIGSLRVAPAGRYGHGWRKAWLEWRVRSHFDGDLAYIQQGARCELWLARRFTRAMWQTPGADTHRRVAVGLGELDRVRTQVAQIITELEHDIDAQRLARYGRARIAAPSATADDAAQWVSGHREDAS